MAREPKASSPSAANAVRGELSIDLEGVTHVLKPSFDAIGRIETATGLSLFQLGRAAEDMSLTLAHAAIIIAECIRAHARSEGDRAMATVRNERIAELLYAEAGGVMEVLSRTIRPLTLIALTGGFTASGEAKAGMGTKTSPMTDPISAS